ncbi:MAG: hypothetical protein GY713_08810 [Actinomycetia bacterium]|nr:hypothetical protein [Actinomycetes bacterium]
MGEREELGGVIGPTIVESTPWWPDPPPVEGKPNLVVPLAPAEIYRLDHERVQRGFTQQ